MSNRNSQANKQAARERLREERARQAKRDKIRRQLVVGGSIVAVLALATGVGVAVSQMGSDDANAPWKTVAAKKTFAKPANTSGPNGTTIVIGDAKAKNTVDVYEDLRCPVCSQFEQNTGAKFVKDIQDGRFKGSFTFGTFLDGDKSQRGVGSKNALSALGAALNVSPEAFLDYKTTLYSAKNHPEETEDKFAEDDHLIKIAQQVKELKGNKAFEKAVTKGTYDTWAMRMSAKFNKVKDITGTPSFKLNGAKMSVAGAPEGTPIITPQQFDAAYDAALKAKK